MNGIRIISLSLCFLLLIACTTAEAQISVDTFLSSFSSPIDLQAPPDGTDRLFVVERGGFVRIIEDIFGTPIVRPDTFINVSTQIVSGGERGLLGMTFHPDYASNGLFYLFYTDDLPGDSVRVNISQWSVSANPNIADDESETVLLQVKHFMRNHNAGQLAFGPDGYLYIGMGDGGGGGDPRDNGEDPTTLLGTMLRIDVDGNGGPTRYLQRWSSRE